MICKDCKEQKHELCRGGTWCDCAHRPTQIIHGASELADAFGGYECLCGEASYSTVYGCMATGIKG